MPFIVPALPAIAKLGATIGTGLIGSKLAKPSQAQTQQTAQLNNLSNEALTRSRTADQLASESRKTGMSFLSRFTNQLSQPANYFQRLLSGDPTSTLSALAPQIGQMRGTQNAALTQATNLAPRGGARSSLLFDLPLSNAAQTSSLLGQSRMGAASTLPQIAQQSGDVGSNFLRLGESQAGQAQGYFGNAGDLTMGSLKQANANQEQSYKQGQAFANMFAPVFDKLDWAKLFSGLGRGAPATSTNPFNFVMGMG